MKSVLTLMFLCFLFAVPAFAGDPSIEMPVVQKAIALLPASNQPAPGQIVIASDGRRGYPQTDVKDGIFRVEASSQIVIDAKSEIAQRVAKVSRKNPKKDSAWHYILAAAILREFTKTKGYTDEIAEGVRRSALLEFAIAGKFKGFQDGDHYLVGIPRE